MCQEPQNPNCDFQSLRSQREYLEFQESSKPGGIQSEEQTGALSVRHATNIKMCLSGSWNILNA